MTTHTDENPSTSKGSSDFSDAAATTSGDIKVEKIEDDFDFLEDDEMYEEEELEDVKLSYEETEELSTKKEFEDKAWDAEEIVKHEADNEEKEDFSQKLKEKKTKVVVKEELLIIEEDIEGEIEE